MSFEIPDKTVSDIMTAMIHKALDGDADAARVVLSYAIGTPTAYRMMEKPKPPAGANGGQQKGGKKGFLGDKPLI